MRKSKRVFNIFLGIAFGLFLVMPLIPYLGVFFTSLAQGSQQTFTQMMGDIQNNRLIYYYLRSVGSQIYSLYSWCKPFDDLHWVIYGAINQGTDANYFMISYFIYVLYITTFYVIAKLVIAIPMMVDKFIEKVS